MSGYYRIGEFAGRAGVSVKTLRFYDEIGVLRPVSVDSRTGYRRYSPQQLEEMASILALKSLGASLSQIRRLTGVSVAAGSRKAILLELRRRIERSIRTATESLTSIDAALAELGEGQGAPPIFVKRRPAVPIACLRVRVKSYEDVPPIEEQVRNAVPTACVGNLRGVLWHRCADSGSLEAEPFVALKREVPTRVRCDVRQLPEATLACAYSGLDDESAEKAYIAIREWMKARGYRLAGAKREINHDEMLEIQFPLATN